MATFLVGLVAVTVGAALGWLSAQRKSAELTRPLELELASARASLAAKDMATVRMEGELRESRTSGDQLERQLSHAHAEFARAETEAKLARTQVVELQQQLAHVQQSLTHSGELNARREAELRAAAERRDALEAELSVAEAERSRAQMLAESLARAEAQLAAEKSKAVESSAAGETMKLQFEAISKRLLDEKMKQSAEGLDGLLAPVKERLKAFEEKVQQTYDVENRDRATLFERLKLMTEAQNKLHADTQALSRALTGDAKTQGDWGELVLESLLKSSGLTEGREFELQVGSVGEDGKQRRPDAIVYLPPDRAIVIDAKCSLTAFAQATKAATDDEREDCLAAHVESVRRHVRLLGEKDYTLATRRRTADFVCLFVPNEAAFHAALSRDSALLEDALRQGVVVVSPTTLLPTLQMVRHVWRTERQTENAQRIAEEAGKMIDKLTGAMESFSVIGQRLTSAQDAYEEARTRLTGRGSVLRLASRVQELGARSKKPEDFNDVQRSLDIESTEPADEGEESAQLSLMPPEEGEQPC